MWERMGEAALNTSLGSLPLRRKSESWPGGSLPGRGNGREKLLRPVGTEASRNAVSHRGGGRGGTSERAGLVARPPGPTSGVCLSYWESWEALHRPQPDDPVTLKQPQLPERCFLPLG